MNNHEILINFSIQNKPKLNEEMVNLMGVLPN